MASIYFRNFRPSFRRELFSVIKKSTALRNCAFYSETKTSIPNSNETSQFKAAVLHPKKHNLTIETMVLPQSAEENMVKVGIEYCALNHFDVNAIHKEINSVTLPFIPGSQFSGEILDIGPKCSREFKIGEKVVVFGDTLTGGGLSQHCFVPETECIRIDTNKISLDIGAIVQSYANAIVAFSKYVQLKENDDVIVLAGPGGDGFAAIEVATKVFKANVLAVFASSSVDALVRDDNVEKAINSNVGLSKVYNFIKSTDKTFKVIYDAYDSRLLHVGADFISPSGHFLTVDPYFSAEKFEPPYFRKDTGKKTKKERKVEKVPEKVAEEIEDEPKANWVERVKRVNIASYQISEPEYYEKVISQVYDLCATEQLEPLISQTYKLKDINKAVNFINNKKCLGNVLVEMQDKK